MNTNPLAKRILCFGDSNTRGFVAGSGGEERHGPGTRWTGRLQMLLGDGYEIIEEGLDARMTRHDDPRPGYAQKNATHHLLPCLESHKPLDLVIIMLGTADAKEVMNLSPEQIAAGMEELIKITQGTRAGVRHAAPKILVMSPAPLIDTTREAMVMFRGCAEKTRQLAPLYQALAARYHCFFCDISACAKVDESEGIHLTRESHAALAGKLAGFIKESIP